MRIQQTQILSILTAALLAACGGSDGTSAQSSSATSSTGSTSASSAGPPLSSTGSISAFGSVFINGNHFNVDHAQITVDDNPAAEQDLQVGQTATVTGTAAVGANMAVATSVAVHSQVMGSVTSVDAATNSFVVLGQTVRVTSATTFNADFAPADITGIHVNDLVTVHGAVTADGSISARRIDRATTAMGLLVAGTVANVNTTAHTFTLNALTVDFGSAMLLGFSSGSPANGDRVRVRGTLFTAASSTLVATAVTRVPAPPFGPAAPMVEVEGLVTRFASLTDFDVAGQKVTTTNETHYVNGLSADIALNANVEVHGSMNSDGVLTATAIDVHNNSDYELSAPVTALDATTNSLTVMGVTVTVNALTRREDFSAAHVRNFAFSDLRVGDNVAVIGYESPAGSGQVIATMLTRLPASSIVEVAGPYTATTAPQFKILSVVVDSSSATFYADRNTTLTSTQFFGQAGGRHVAVIGTGSVPLTASKVLLLPVDSH